MSVVARYEREDIEALIREEAARFGSTKKPTVWICECGCDLAQWFVRTPVGLLFALQAYPQGVDPQVVCIQTREDLERFIDVTVMGLRKKAKKGGTEGPHVDRRIDAFTKTIWTVWFEQ